MYLLIHEDGNLQQAEEITDDDRRQIADGTLQVVKENAGRFFALYTEGPDDDQPGDEPRGDLSLDDEWQPIPEHRG